MIMKDVYRRGLTGLDTVGNSIGGRQSSFRTVWVRIKVAVGGLFVIQDADNLPHFYHKAPVIVREEGTLTEEVVSVRATSLLAQGTDLVLTGLSAARLRIRPAARTRAAKIISDCSTSNPRVV